MEIFGYDNDECVEAFYFEVEGRGIGH